MTPFRVGFGYDVHQLKAGLPLVIGGVMIPHQKGALGHSDADVLVHAIMDALLGAAGLGDIGQYFPDTDPAFKGISSMILLRRVVDMLDKQHYSIGNADATICLQTPRLAPHIPLMAETLSKAMGVSVDQISVKATTTERLGFTGQELGVSAHAVVLIYKRFQ